MGWDPISGLRGVEPGGAVHHAARLGSTWEQPGNPPGAAQALLPAGEVLYAAAPSDEVTGIWQSADGGETWQLLYRDRRGS